MILWGPSTLERFAVRQMLRRPGRTLMTLLGIAFGVATIVAVTMTTQATRSAYRDMFTTVTGSASLEVVAEGLGGFDAGLVDKLGKVPGVKAALPVIQTTAALVGKAGPVPVLVLGIDPDRDGAARGYGLQSGRRLEGNDGVLLEAGFARANGCELGKAVRLWTPTGIMELPLVGLLQSQGPTTFNGGAVAIMPLATAQRLFGLPRQVNSIQFVLEDGTTETAVEASLRAQLPPGLHLQTPSARGERAREALYAIEQTLQGISFVTLCAGAFVILNTFLMNLTERRRQLAILRALGATRRQVTALLLREAVLLGLAGTVLGVGGGYVLALGVVAIMAQMLGGVTLPDLNWSKEAIFMAAAFGPGMALAATWLPARRAARRAPLDDLLARGGVFHEESRSRAAYVGLALIALHLLCLLGLGRGWLRPWLFAPVMPIGIVGCVLALPLVIGPLMRWVGFLVKRPLGLEGKLAMRQLQRRPLRVSLTVGILAIALFVGIGVGHALLASVRDTRDWTGQVVAADFYIRGTQPDGAYAITMTALPEKLEDEIARVDGVERVDKLDWILASAQGKRIVIIACTFPPGRRPAIQLVGGDPQTVIRHLRDGDVVIGTALAKGLRLGVGDTITIDTRDGPRALRVAATANEYTIQGLAVIMEWQAARQLFQPAGVHVFMVKAKDGQLSSLSSHLKTYCAEHQLLLQSGPELRDYVDQAVGRFTGLVWSLMAMVFIVASLAIVNTLTMNALEQTRELGILRAVGLKRIQVRKLILSQALAVGLMSLAPGIVVGMILAFLFNLLSHLLLAHAVPFHIEFGLIAVCSAVAVAVAVIAALLPAARAAKLQVVEALQYE
jgi:putative ABC transport system permease protein